MELERVKVEYDRFLVEFAAGTFDRLGKDSTLNELFLAFMKYAANHYTRADGTNTHEVEEFRYLIRLVREIFGDTLAREFGTLRLKTCREVMVGRGWCRNRVNHMTNRLRRIFRWAVAEKIVIPSVLDALKAVAGLQRGVLVQRVFLGGFLVVRVVA